MKRVVIISQDDYDEAMNLLNRAIQDMHTYHYEKELVAKDLIKVREILWSDDE